MGRERERPSFLLSLTKTVVKRLYVSCVHLKKVTANLVSPHFRHLFFHSYAGWSCLGQYSSLALWLHRELLLRPIIPI